MVERGWNRAFDQPISLPGRKELITLRDGANYATSLPAETAERDEWKAAIEALMLVAERGGPTMFARIGIMRALNIGKAEEPRKKAAKKYRVIP